MSKVFLFEEIRSTIVHILFFKEFKSKSRSVQTSYLHFEIECTMMMLLRGQPERIHGVELE